METSCTYVASADWAVMLGSLTVAFVGYGILVILRNRRLESEGPEPKVSVANA
jgi:hypothetical protein